MQASLRSRINLQRLFVQVFVFLLIALPQTSFAENKVDKNYIFLVDLSGSMAGPKLTEAKSALRTILRSDVIKGQVAIVSFDTKVKRILPPTNDIESALASIEQLNAYGNTALFDGVNESLKVANEIGNAVILVITDGKDNSSQSSLESTSTNVHNFVGNIHFISIGQDPNLLKVLETLAGDKGTVRNVDDIANLLQSLTPLVTEQNSKMAVNLAKIESDEKIFKNWFYLLLISSIFIFFSLIMFYSNRRQYQKKLHILQAFDDEATREKMNKEDSLFYRAMRFALFSTYVKNEEKRLLAAGVAVNVRTWIYTQITVFIIVSIFFISIGMEFILAVLFAGFFGFGIGKFYLSSARTRKSQAFAEELPDTLVIISSSLKSGLSFNQAIESVANEGGNEVALQFKRVLAEVQLGKLLTDSLLDVADRMQSADFRWTISALSIQREVGGNLSDILTTTAETIRGRAEIRREVKALSAEGRMSAYVLVALPFFMLLYLQVTKPEYVKIMFTNPIGIGLMSVVGILISAGWFWTKKVVVIKF